MMTDVKTRRPDLGQRTVTALVMVVLAALAMWQGGPVWTGFVLLISAGVLWEWFKLTRAMACRRFARLVWLACGLVYTGIAADVLIGLRSIGIYEVLLVIVAVAATDIGAYFAGRGIGGPKIAPAISPSKTWAGLGGGMVAAAASIMLLKWLDGDHTRLLGSLIAGGLIAVIAQSGDFFESWMKRRAGVKDSGNMLPGHGGLFDRFDGLLAVCWAFGMIELVSSGFGSMV